jgi:predicted DNA-binding transcriptional regulator AlpA
MTNRSLDEERRYAPDFVSAETLAYRLDCSRSTIDACVRSGFLPKPQKIGNLQRWDFGQVKAYIRAQNSATSINGMASDHEDAFMKGLESEPSRKGAR